MRATELVGRADKEITAERLKIVKILPKKHLDIRKSMRSIVYSVHIEKSLGTEASDNSCSSCNVRDGSTRVGRCAQSNKPRVAIQQILKMVKIQEAAARFEVHPE